MCEIVERQGSAHEHIMREEGALHRASRPHDSCHAAYRSCVGEVVGAILEHSATGVELEAVDVWRRMNLDEHAAAPPCHVPGP